MAPKYTPAEHLEAAKLRLQAAEKLPPYAPGAHGLYLAAIAHTLIAQAPETLAPVVEIAEAMPTARELLDAAPKKAPARRKKAPAPAPAPDVVPGSEEDLIRREAAK